MKIAIGERSLITEKTLPHCVSIASWIACGMGQLRKIVSFSPLLIACVFGVGMLTGGCGANKKDAAEAQAQRQSAPSVTPVDVAVARTDSLKQQAEYTGTTVPFKIVSLRSQIQGQL